MGAGEPIEGGPIAGIAAVKAFEMEVARIGLAGDEEASEAGFEHDRDDLGVPVT